MTVLFKIRLLSRGTTISFFLPLMALVLAVLAGCAGQGPKFHPPGPVFEQVANRDPNRALIYIYRPVTFALGGRAAYFYINDVNVFDINIGGYSWVELPPGTYKLNQKWAFDVIAKSIEMNIAVKAGEVRYMSFQTGGCGSGGGQICISYTLQEQPELIAGPAIADKHFQDNFGLSKLNAVLGGARN